MANLLKAEFIRLFRSIFFWVCVFGCFFFALHVIMFEKSYVNHYWDYPHYIRYLFEFSLYLTIAMAVFVCFFVNSDYSYGTMRNKIVTGTQRHHIYFSKLITCCVANATFFIVSMIFGLIFGEILIGNPVYPYVKIFGFTVAVIFALFAITALFMVPSMLSNSKTVSIICCLFILFAFHYTSDSIDYSLSISEYEPSYTYYSSLLDQEVYVEGSYNSAYVGGSIRTMFVFFNYFLPTSQLLQLSDYLQPEIKNVPVFILYDILFIGISTLCGVVIFREKDIK